MASAVLLLLPSLRTKAGDLTLHTVSPTAFLHRRNLVSPVTVVIIKSDT